MTSPGLRNTTAAAALVLVLTLAVEGCGAATDSDSGSDSARRQPTPSAPAATGTGPYPTPTATPPSSDPGRPATSRPPSSERSPQVAVPDPGDVDRTDADAVGKGTLTTMWTFDTTVDTQPYDAELRTADAGWLTTAYANLLRAHQAQSVPDAQWQKWSAHHAHTTVTLQTAEDAAKPADTGTEAWRQWIVTATPHGDGGWTGTPTRVVTYVHLTRPAAGKPWHTADVTVQ